MDERDTALHAQIAALWDQQSGPRVGDYVTMADGSIERFSHDWGDEIQTSPGGSWFIGTFGGPLRSNTIGHAYVSFSGGLNPSVPITTLRDTGKQKDGRFWFWHHNQPGADRGIDAFFPCRMYQVT